MSIKVAYLLGSLNRGGTETLLLDVFRNAGKSGLHAIGIYRKPGVLESDFLNTGIEMKYIPDSKNPIKYILRLRNHLLNYQIEIVHAQQPIDAFYAYMACFGLKIKCVLTFHGYDFTEKALGKHILNFIIRKTDRNIFVSDTQRQYYEKKYKLDSNKQKVVYNGISFEKLGLTPDQTLSRPLDANLRNELNLTQDTLLIGAVGNFNEVRDQMTTCRFLKLLSDQQLDFHFVFVGKRVENSPNLYDNCVDYCIQNKLIKRVSFLGVRNDVPQILKELEAFVYSTDHDTFGIALVEAMAVSIPVFVNDWGVMQEITALGKYASLYKTKDETDLLRQFLLFLQNKPAHQQKAKNAAEYVCKKFSIENHIHQLKGLYSSL
jgi:glycosyltransferase involved in cell wall biosynthesis